MAYTVTKFSLTESQLEKIAKAIHSKSEFTLRLNKTGINVQGYGLPLTKTQVNKIKDGNVHDIKFSLAQVKYISNKIKIHVGGSLAFDEIKKGGFLPLIPIIASVLAGLGTAAGAVASRVQQAKADQETKRHNEAVEKQLKEGTGLKLGKKKGKGLRL